MTGDVQTAGLAPGTGAPVINMLLLQTMLQATLQETSIRLIEHKYNLSYVCSMVIIQQCQNLDEV